MAGAVRAVDELGRGGDAGTCDRPGLASFFYFFLLLFMFGEELISRLV